MWTATQRTDETADDAKAFVAERLDAHLKQLLPGRRQGAFPTGYGAVEHCRSSAFDTAVFMQGAFVGGEIEFCLLFPAREITDASPVGDHLHDLLCELANQFVGSLSSRLGARNGAGVNRLPTIRHIGEQGVREIIDDWTFGAASRNDSVFEHRWAGEITEKQFRFSARVQLLAPATARDQILRDIAQGDDDDGAIVWL